jgi:uroporphyrinogen-III decarboxylase
VDPALFAKARFTKQSDGQLVELPDGRVILCPWDDDPRQKSAREPYPDFEDTDPETIPVSQEIPDWQFLATRIAVNAVGASVGVHGSVGSPFDRFVFHFGLEQALAGLAMDLERCRTMVERFAEQQFFYAKAQLDIGVQAVCISSPFAGGGFVSPEMYRQIVLPGEGRLVDKLKAYAPNVYIYTHTCGKIGDRLELMADTGIDGIECLDPPPLGNTELADAKRRVGGRVFLKGSLDSVHELLGITEPAGLERYVRSMLADGAPSGGYILSTACSIAPHVPPWIIEGLVPLAETYGRYPLTRV